MYEPGSVPLPVGILVRKVRQKDCGIINLHGQNAISFVYPPMKILQLVNRIPYPLHDGGNLAVHAITEGLLDAGAQLSMLAMNTTRHWVDTGSLPSLYKRLQHFETVTVDNRIRPLGAFFSLLKGSSYNVDRFISKAFEKALIELLQKDTFDIIHLEGLFLAPYITTIRQYSKAKIVMRQHNIEYRIWERLAAQAGNPVKKWYLATLAKQLQAFELKHINDYDLILPISPYEEKAFRSLGAAKPLYLLPFGIDTAAVPFAPAVTEPVSVYHIGAMDWLPNQESVNWLLDKVWPLVIKEIPEVKLYLAGRNMPVYYTEKQWPNVVVAGEVPDAAAFEQDKSILAVPLLSGGGVRIKIFQAMAMGKTVVTTAIGLEGMDASDGQEVLIADDALTFASKMIAAIKDPERLQVIGNAARKLMLERYDRGKLTLQLLERYKELIEG